MPRTRTPRRLGCREWSRTIVLILLLAGCNSQKPLVYEDNEGFHFVPPAGLSVPAATRCRQGQAIASRICPCRL
jgi:hypothetical protein